MRAVAGALRRAERQVQAPAPLRSSGSGEGGSQYPATEPVTRAAGAAGAGAGRTLIHQQSATTNVGFSLLDTLMNQVGQAKGAGGEGGGRGGTGHVY